MTTDGRTARHCRLIHVCFIFPSPPNFFISLQNEHSPHSDRVHASHLRHRTRRRRTLLDERRPDEDPASYGVWTAALWPAVSSDDFTGDTKLSFTTELLWFASPEPANLTADFESCTPFPGSAKLIWSKNSVHVTRAFFPTFDSNGEFQWSPIVVWDWYMTARNLTRVGYTKTDK